MLAAIEIRFGLLDSGLRSNKLGVRLADVRFACSDLCGERAAGGGGLLILTARLEIGCLRLFNRKPEIAVVEAKQDVALADNLRVHDRRVDDRRGDQRRYLRA